MYRLRFKTLAEIDRLPVWTYYEQELRLQWWPKADVLGRLLRCESCGLWVAGVICHACQDQRAHEIYCAQSCVLEALTVWEPRL